jgi:hypothetical protein
LLTVRLCKLPTIDGKYQSVLGLEYMLLRAQVWDAGYKSRYWCWFGLHYRHQTLRRTPDGHLLSQRFRTIAGRCLWKFDPECKPDYQPSGHKRHRSAPKDSRFRHQRPET